MILYQTHQQQSPSLEPGQHYKRQCYLPPAIGECLAKTGPSAEPHGIVLLGISSYRSIFGTMMRYMHVNRTVAKNHANVIV